MALDKIELDTGGDAVGTVSWSNRLWLHGLVGADGSDFEPIVPMLRLSVPLRFVFPHAPVRPVTINGGMEMRAWYDIDPRSPLAGSDDIRVSGDQVEQLVHGEEAQGVPRSRIVLAGFSQGGVVALHLGLRSAARFAGVMALSTYVHNHERLAEEISFASVDMPVFMAHGQMDPMIPIARAITSREALAGLGYSVEWREYGMGHEVCPQEIADIGRWLNDLLG